MSITPGQELIIGLSFKAEQLNGRPVLGWLMSDKGVAVRLVEGTLLAQQSGSDLYISIETEDGTKPLCWHAARRLRPSLGGYYFESGAYDFSEEPLIDGDEIFPGVLVDRSGQLVEFIQIRLNLRTGEGHFRIHEEFIDPRIPNAVEIRRVNGLKIPIQLSNRRKVLGTPWYLFDFTVQRSTPPPTPSPKAG